MEPLLSVWAPPSQSSLPGNSLTDTAYHSLPGESNPTKLTGKINLHQATMKTMKKLFVLIPFQE